MGSPSSRIGLPFCFRIDRILYSLLDLRECLFEICEKVIDVFDTYGDADGTRGDAGCLLGFRGKLLVGCGSRVNDKRLGVTDISQVREDLKIVDEFSCCIKAILEFDGEDGACALWQVFQLQLVVRGRFEARIVDFSNLRVLFEEFCDSGGIVDVAFYAERQGFEALNEEPGGDRGNASPGITENLRTDTGHEACARYVSCKVDAVIGCIRRSEVRVSFRLVPVELAIFYDRAAQGRTVATDEFRGGVNHDIQTMFQWTEEIRRREGIINDDRQAVGVSNVADGIEIRDIDGRIPQRFDIDCLVFSVIAASISSG